MKKLKILFFAWVSLLPMLGYPFGGAADTEWPRWATVEVQLNLSATLGPGGQVKVSGDLLIKNPSDAALIIQSPRNRLALAFLAFDPLGNPVVPIVCGKADPGFDTRTLSPRATYTQHFESLDFVTGGALLSYDLRPGKKYRVVAVYRPAGANGPGFTSQETKLEIPQTEKRE